ncbi:MAG: hypothetical protein OEZ35_01640 [Candidatus Bathyarchaeota archaeon]|nr:hypothetical protein [Candidatus Bathyarchaeota archaeon]
MKLSELFGWIIGALDLVFMVYSIFDFAPFILMVGISLTYIAIMIVKNRKLNVRAMPEVKSQTYVQEKTKKNMERKAKWKRLS